LIQQKNNLVENIRLVCEINVETAGIENEIIKTIQADIKNQLHLKIPVELLDNFNITGNKLKMIEYI
jgi:hypothetical protein